MINKKTFIFNTLAEALTFKIGADPKNTTYRLGSFAEDAEIKTGEPDPEMQEALLEVFKKRGADISLGFDSYEDQNVLVEK